MASRSDNESFLDDMLNSSRFLDNAIDWKSLKTENGLNGTMKMAMILNM